MSCDNRSRYAAALQDCEELLNRLETKGIKVDFDIFAKVWREMSFSLIFCGRTSEEDLIEFTDDLFLAAKSCWLPPHTTNRRLSAAYLIYGLYFKQPAKNACKFKVTKQEWEEISKYFDFVKRHNLSEHYYMFCKLIENDAFRYSATPYEVHLDKRSRRAENATNLASGSEVNNAFDTMVITGFFESISDLETKYKNAKKQLEKSDPNIANELADIADNDLGKKLRSMCIRRCLEVEADQGTGAAVPIDNEERPDVEDIGERRAALKQRTLAYESDKAEESAWSTEDDADDPDAVPRSKRRRRERGYHMVKNFRQREEMRFVQGDDNYCLHSKSSRTLHNNPMHNFMSGKRIRKPYRAVGDGPSLDYLSKATEYATEAKRTRQQYRTIEDNEFTGKEEQSCSKEDKKIKEDSDQDDSYVITNQDSADEEKDEPSDISGRMSNLSIDGEDIKHEQDILTEERIKPEVVSDTSSNSIILNMPLI